MNDNPFIRRFGIVIPPSWPPGGGDHGKHEHHKIHHKTHHKEPNSDSELMGAGIGTILILLPFLI